MEQVVEMFIEKQRQRLADGKIRQEEYEAFIDGINDALSFLGMLYVNSSETVEHDARKAATFNEIEENYKKFREVAMYKNSFLRESDIIKHSGQMTDELQKITRTVKEEL